MPNAGARSRLPVSNIAAGSGEVELKFEDGQAAAATADTITVGQHQRRPAATSTSPPARAAPSPAMSSLTGQMTSPLGTTTIAPRRQRRSTARPTNSSAPHGDADRRQGRDRRGDDIRIDLDPDQFNASAQGDIHVTANRRPDDRRHGRRQAPATSILTAGTANGGPEDIVLLTANVEHRAAGGTVTFRRERHRRRSRAASITAQRDGLVSKGLQQRQSRHRRQRATAGADSSQLGRSQWQQSAKRSSSHCPPANVRRQRSPRRRQRRRQRRRIGA